MTNLSRTATVSRKTGETDIEITLNLDGAGQADVDTGLGFLDHMLHALARHARFDLTVRAKGDLHLTNPTKNFNIHFHIIDESINFCL